MRTVLKVDVTRKDIEKSILKDARKCAIARAIVDSDPDIYHANVTHDWIKIHRHSTQRVTAYRTPKPARDFITDFDAQRKPKAFTLVITEKDFVSERPNQAHQKEKAIEVQQRRTIATATNRKLRDVKPDEVEPAGWSDPPKLIKEKVIRPSKPSTAKRPYARRETAAEVFAKKMGQGK